MDREAWQATVHGNAKSQTRLSDNHSLTHSRKILKGLPQWLRVKESACNAGATVSIPGSERALGGGHRNSPQSSCLKNPMERGAWWPIVHRVAKNQTQLK